MLQDNAIAALAAGDILRLRRLEENVGHAITYRLHRSIGGCDDRERRLRGGSGRQQTEVDAAVLVVGRRPAHVVFGAPARIVIDIGLDEAGLVRLADERHRKLRTLLCKRMGRQPHAKAQH